MSKNGIGNRFDFNMDSDAEFDDNESHNVSVLNNLQVNGNNKAKKNLNDILMGQNKKNDNNNIRDNNNNKNKNPKKKK